MNVNCEECGFCSDEWNTDLDGEDLICPDCGSDMEQLEDYEYLPEVTI